MLEAVPLLLLLAAAMNDPHPGALVGQYDGGQMEMAAGLELSADGRFRYGLSYGALDEQAAGTWRAEGKRVLLDSDPVKAPHFSLIGQAAAPAGTVRVSLAVPEGMDPQYFRAVVLFEDGATDGGQLSVDGLSLPLQPGQRPASVRIALRIFDIVSDPIPVDIAKGLDLSFRFEPNDLGQVDFRDTVLEEDGGQLTLNRYDRLIRFRRAGH